jgi:hypothetical protein
MVFGALMRSSSTDNFRASTAAMYRGLRAQLSPNEENALRKIAAGSTEPIQRTRQSAAPDDT